MHLMFIIIIIIISVCQAILSS